MKTSEFLAQLTSLGIRLSLEGGDLRIKAPKGALTPEVREELAARKPELVELLGAPAAARAPASLPPIEPASREGRVPLSFTQERIWFMDQLEPGITAYNMWVACRLKGALDVGVLERALTEVVRRHEVLRTTLSSEDGIPFQKIAPPPAEGEVLPVERIEGLDEIGPRPTDEDLRRLLTPRIDTPFDLEQGPLWRPSLVRLADDEHVLFIAVHHAVFDGVSQGVFFRELVPLYEAFAQGRPSPLPELPVQYADYSVWQRTLFEESGFGGQLDYWKRVLGGELPVLELPTDHTRPAVQTHNGATAYHWVTQSTIEALNRAAKAKGATLFMVLLAAYKAFLHRYTGQTDLLVGTAMANRNRAEIEPLLGFFVNTLVMRTDASGDPTFRELMVRVRDVCLGALENQDMPFQLLVDELQPARSLSHTPLFQTMFVLDEDPGDSRAMSALELDGVDLAKHFARTDLVMTGYKGRDGFFFWVEYNTDLFEHATIERMLAHFVQLLEGIAADPDRRLSELPMLSPDDVGRLTRGWNETASEYPAEPLHRQFEAQVDRTPEATALWLPTPQGAGDERLGYRELDRRANRIAHHLIDRGVRPGDLVGLCLERSIDMVAAQLAILKAGAAYVPLDPLFPPDRLTYMVADSGLRHVVSTSELAELLPDVDAQRLELDTEADALAARGDNRPGVAIDAAARMYVIYTSGSTGRPKGVELEHRSVSNFMASMAREPGFSAGETLLAVTTLSFDISVLEIFLPLVTGGTVAIATSEVAADGELLRAVLERVAPQVMQATPATWRMLSMAGWQGDPGAEGPDGRREGGLRIFCGGEALPRELANELLPLGRELWNLYGPTETTIWSTVWRVAPEGPVLIGRPIGNTNVYVLDEHKNPTPAGVPGHLWIGGAGLARGYLDRPELTSERFVPDPFAESANGHIPRMYHTGDLARWCPDGALECLGRVDNQVKLRGFRIELGEIEAVLADDPSVRQAVAVVREETPGDQRLIAYLVLEGAADGELDPGALRERCRGRMPAYMIPSGFVALEELPLTPNGKVDRRALLALEHEAATGGGGDYVAPSTETEEALAAIWSELLKLERISTLDNFFDLGGHSLLSVQVTARVRDRLGVRINPRDLMLQNLGQLAAVLEERAARDAALEDERHGPGRRLVDALSGIFRRRRE